MKQTITTQRKSPGQRYLRLSGLILSLLLVGVLGLQAQKVSWTTGYPKLSPTTLTALDDPGYLDVYFTPTVANITNAKLEVTLPAGITYLSTENGTGHTAAITYGTPSVSGQVVTVSFTSNGNSLKTGEAVSVRLKVSANCSAVNGATSTVKVLSGTSLVTSGQQSATIGVQIPTIRVQCSAPIQNYATQSEVKDFELSLDAPIAPAGSFLLVLTGDAYSTLSTFTLDGAPITPVSANVVSGSTKLTTIKLTETELGGKLGTTAKILKFKAGNTRCGSRMISTSVQYSATVNCNTQVGATLTMSFPSIAGLSKIDFTGYAFWNAPNGTAYTSYQMIPKDLSTVYQKMSFKNNGTADAYNARFNAMGLFSERGGFGYIDEKNIQYDIDGGTLQTLPAANSIGSNTVANNSSAGYLQPAYSGKFIKTNVTLPGVVPAGSTVTFWIPTHIGVIYNNAKRNVFLDYWTRANWGYYASSFSSENLCSESSMNPYIVGGYINDVFFREVPGQMIVKSGDTYDQEIRIAANALNSTPAAYSVAELVINMPDWMDLANGNPETDILIANSLAPIVAGSGTSSTSGGFRRYAVKIANVSNSNAVVTFKYKAGACISSSVNQTDSIGYYINWQMGQASATNPSFDNCSQVFQSVTMLCKKDGIQLDNFQTIRTTRGLKDSTDDGIPDDGTEALEPEINNDYYMIDHNGYFKWNATVLGSASDTYIHWYAPVTLTGITLNHVIPSSGTATIQVNGGAPATVSYTKLDNYRFYLHYDASATPLKGGDLIEVQFPFIAKSATNTLYDITSECFVSNVAFADPFSSSGNTNRHGDDKAVYPVAIFNDNFTETMDFSSKTFPNNTAQANSYHGLTSYFHNAYASPKGYFKNEVMRKYYPKQVVWTVPLGYRFNGNMVLTYVKRDAPTSQNISIAPVVTKNAAGATIYTYDVAAYFDESYNGSGSLAAGKQMVPDDKWYIQHYPTVQATRSAPLGNSTVYRLATMRDVQHNVDYPFTTLGASYIYSGLTTTLALSTTTLPAYSSKLSIPVVTIGNPTATNLNKMWLYVEGNVSNISIIPSGGGTAINGTGYEGRWIEVTNSIMAPGSSLDYKMDFTYGGSNDCSTPDKITVYTVSGFDNPSWDPTTVNGAAINLDDILLVGAYKSLNITAAPAKIEGQIETSTQTVSFNTAYTLKVTLDSRSSQGSVKDASMTITIPAGQKYTPNSARLEYPIGTTPAAIPATLESALVAANSNLTTTRTVTFTSPLLLSGYLATGTDSDRQMVLTAEYKAQCETNLTGFNYTGILNGKTACGDIAAGDGAEVFNSKVFANVITNYNFAVTVGMKSGNNAFNEKRTSDALRVTLNKQSGIGINMLATDNMSIHIPKEFNISGTASIPTGFASGSAISTISNTIVGNERVLVLSLPVSAFNADPNKGLSQNVIYEIPLVYTPSGQDLATTPEHIISATVMTNGKFDASCPDAVVQIGTNTLDIAVVTAVANQVMACLNSATTLEITSTDFGGSWYKEPACTTNLGTGLTYSYTPTVQQDTVIYVSAIFNSVNYGVVPMNVQMYPEATITITAPSAICLGSSVNISSGTVSGTPSGSTVKYYSDAAATTELTGAGLTVSPTTATTYYAQVTTTQGCKSLPTAILVSVNPLPVITLVTDKTDDKVCIDTDITFTTESAMTNYVWNLGGATVTTSGGTSTSNTAVLQWNTSGTKTVTVNYTDANGCTATAAKTKSITVMPATVITTQPAVDPAIKLSNGYIIPGSNVSLNVVAATGPTLTYQWYWKKLSDGTVVTLSDARKYSGTTSSTLLISNAYEEENGDYYVTVTGCGTTTSAPVTVIAVANQDASLKDLKVDGTTLWDFNPATINYMTTVNCAQEQVTILGIPNNPNYTSITGNGTFQLAPGDNLFTITVVAQDMVTTMTYTVNVIRDCYIPKILKDLEDAVICVGDTHTFEIDVQGENLTYEWYYGLNRIMGANTNSLTISDAVLGDYERYYVVIRSHYNGFKSSAFSKKVRLWVADQLPTHLKFSDYPNPAITGNTYHIKVDGYTDVTKYTWSYDKEGVSFSPGADLKWGNEAWGTFGTLSAGNGILKVTMEHPCGTRELILPISVKYPTGTEDVTATTVQVYPNPTSGILKVSGTEMNQQIRVLDITGSLKGTYKSMEGTTTIDLTGYAKGTYMVQYDGKTYKVIKK